MGPKRGKGKSDDGGSAAKRKKVDTEDTGPKLHWQWEGDGGIWTSYSTTQNNTISSFYNDGKKKISLEVGSGQIMEMDCDKMIQKNKKTKFQRRLRCAIWEDSSEAFYNWEWEDERGKWNPYSADISVQMEEAKQKGDTSVNIVAASRSYSVNITTMEQENTVTKVIRKVQRSVLNVIKQEEEDEPAASSSATTESSRSKRKSAASKSTGGKSGRVKEEPMDDDEAAPKTKSTMKKVVMKGQAPVDEDCPIQHKSHVFCEGKDIWDCMLNQTDVGNNNNKYYLIQILEEDAKKAYHVWQRWGRVGYKGQNNLVPCGANLENAKKVFSKKFSDKTRNDWATRSSFVKVHGKYDLVKLDYSAKPLDTPEEEGKKPSLEKSLSVPDSKLDKRIQNLIELICDVKTMEDAVMEMEFDAKKAPLGRLTADQVKAGYAALKKIDDCINSGQTGHKLTEACNEFYTRIPHEFGMRPPTIIKTKAQVKKKIELLEALADIEIAIKMLKKGDTSENPVDRHYHALNCELIPVEKTCDEFKLVNDYVQNTHASTHRQYKLEVMELYTCTKDGESSKFIDYGNRMLLWHGSRLTNWVGILSQGLRIAPPEAPVTGYMFGKGVYFADMSSKSANYAYPSRAKNVGLLTLCEVSLGQTNDLLNADYAAHKLPSGKHSVKGLGTHAPDPSKYHKTKDGVIIPLGKETKTGVTNPGGFSLNYNEYIVYDVRQIKMRYLVKLKFHFK